MSSDKKTYLEDDNPSPATMGEVEIYESYPAWTIALSNIFSLSVYAIGAYVLAGFGLWIPLLYLVYCASAEVNVLRRSCTGCYYYGKLCCFGRGKLCAKLFKKGDADKFAAAEAKPLDLLPDLMIVAIPLIGGVILSVLDFSLTVLVLMIVLLLLSSMGNAFVRGSIACKHCKQRTIGCPAQKLFEKRLKAQKQE